MTGIKTEILKRLFEEITTTPYSEFPKSDMCKVAYDIRDALGTYEENKYTANKLWCHCNAINSVYQRKTLYHEIEIIRSELYWYLKAVEE